MHHPHNLHSSDQATPSRSHFYFEIYVSMVQLDQNWEIPAQYLVAVNDLFEIHSHERMKGACTCTAAFLLLSRPSGFVCGYDYGNAVKTAGVREAADGTRENIALNDLLEVDLRNWIDVLGVLTAVRVGRGYSRPFED